MRRIRILGLRVLLAIALAAAAHGQALSVLYNFGTKTGDPIQPTFSGIVAQGRDGNLYTTSPSGGSSGLGTVFRISPTGVLKVLFNFDASTGAVPYSGLTLGTDGNFYGVTSTAGNGTFGGVFKITSAGKLTALYSFTGGADGAGAVAPPIQGRDGNFYGTTAGNAGAFHYGTIYKITPAGKLTTLHSFDLTDGAFPNAPLTLGSDGNFYGTAINGGSNGNFGTAFKITPSGQFTLLFSFDGTHGVFPYGPLVQASDGNFYGTTYSGGVSNVGTVYRMTPTGAVTVLHNYNFDSDGGHPFAGLVQGTDGLFYGAAQEGGAGGFGTLYSVDTGGTFNALHAFDQTSGAYPNVTLVQHTNGSFYANTLNGGAHTADGVFYGLGANLAAFVSLVSNAAKPGKTVGILGQGFKGTTKVSFNGVPAIFKVSNGTYLSATVPSGATTGFVTVTTPGGILISNKEFIVLP